MAHFNSYKFDKMLEIKFYRKGKLIMLKKNEALEKDIFIYIYV